MSIARALVLAAATWASAPDVLPSRPTSDDAARVEAAYTTAPVGYPLDRYAVRYFWRDPSDPGVVRALFLTGIRGGEPGRHLADKRDVPMIMDGGCGIVWGSMNKDASTRFFCGGR